MKSQFVPVVNVSAGDRAEMFHLLQQHFAGVRIDIFQADLRSKNWVLLLRDEKGELKGFSTILIYQKEKVEIDSERSTAVSVVYSGDTIVDPSAWSSMTLAKSWIDAINTLKTHYATETLYWFLISSGYRTYRFLPIFWQEFYPRYDAPTPPAVQQFMNQLAYDQFGDRYNAATGIVRLSHPQTLRGSLARVPDERLSDPHIQFFTEKNPNHSQGDELVCLTQICETNLTRAGRRMWLAHQPYDLTQT